MWILSFLPNFAVHIIVSIGLLGVIIGFLLGVIPFVKEYKLPIQVISIILLTLGVYLEGGISEQKEWEIQTAELKTKLAAAEAKSAKENVKIVEKVVKKTEYIKLRGKDIIVEIEKKRDVLDKNCNVPPEFVTIHNKAAEAIK